MRSLFDYFFSRWFKRWFVWRGHRPDLHQYILEAGDAMQEHVNANLALSIGELVVKYAKYYRTNPSLNTVASIREPVKVASSWDVGLSASLNEFYSVCNGIDLRGEFPSDHVLGMQDTLDGADLTPTLSEQVRGEQEAYGDDFENRVEILEFGGSDSIAKLAAGGYDCLLPFEVLDRALVLSHYGTAGVALIVVQEDYEIVKRGMVIELESGGGTLFADIKHWLAYAAFDIRDILPPVNEVLSA